MEVLTFILNPVHKVYPKEPDMKILNSFFIRWLLSTADDDKNEISVIEIEHIQSGRSRRVSKLEEANQWMRDLTGQKRKDDELSETE